MIGPSEDDRRVRFLLGELTDEERASFESEWFENDETFAELEALEEALIEGYCEGVLAAPLSTRFEAAYLTSDARRRRVALTRLLGRLANRRTAAPTERETPSWRNPARWAAVLAAVALVSVLASLAWTRQRTQALEAEREQLRVEVASAGRAAAEQERRFAELHAELERERFQRERLASLLGEVPRAGSVLSLVLRGAQTRSGDEAPQLLLYPETVLVKLLLPVPQAAAGAYRARLETIDGDLLWERGELVARDTAAGPAVVLALVAERLPTGHLVVELSTESAGGGAQIVGEFAFRLLRDR